MGFMDLFAPALGVADIVQKFGSGRRMERIQKKAWAREDNAVQRRMKDLRAAGLSPSLAAGSAAASSAPIAAMQGEQTRSQAFSDKASVALDMMRMKSDIARSQAETDRIRQETRTAQYTADMKEAERNFMMSHDVPEFSVSANLKGKNISPEAMSYTEKYVDPYTRQERLLATGIQREIGNRDIMLLDKEIKNLGLDKERIEQKYREVASKWEYEAGENLNPVLLEWQIKMFEILRAREELGLTTMDRQWLQKLGISPKMLDAFMSILGKTIPTPVMRVGR